MLPRKFLCQQWLFSDVSAKAFEKAQLFKNASLNPKNCRGAGGGEVKLRTTVRFSGDVFKQVA